NTRFERELRDNTSSSRHTGRSTAIRTRCPRGGISDERPIGRASPAPTTKVLLSSAAQPVRIYVRPALAAIALALAMFEQTFGHQKLSIGRGQRAATIADCRPRGHCGQAIADVAAYVAANDTLRRP